MPLQVTAQEWQFSCGFCGEVKVLNLGVPPGVLAPMPGPGTEFVSHFRRQFGDAFVSISVVGSDDKALKIGFDVCKACQKKRNLWDVIHCKTVAAPKNAAKPRRKVGA